MNLKRAIGGPFFAILFLAFFSYVIFGIKWFFVNSVQGQENVTFLGSISNAVQDIPANSSKEVYNLTINAKSAISVESNLKDINKIIFSKDSQMRLPIASLTKLMTAVVVLDNYDLSNTWQIDKIADSQEPMKRDVKKGDILSVKSLLEIMLIESSNKSAYALSEIIGEKKFVDLMNQKAEYFGLKDTYFVDPTGLDSANISTAVDLARFAGYILKDYPKIAGISKSKELYVTGFGTAVNTDQLIGEIPGVVCGKTGFTIAANGCLLLVTNNGKSNDYLINVILGADDRFSEMKKLISWSNSVCN